MAKFEKEKIILKIAKNYVRERQIVLVRNPRRKGIFSNIDLYSEIELEILIKDLEEMAANKGRLTDFYFLIDDIYAENIEYLLSKWNFKEINDYIFVKPKQIVIQGSNCDYRDNRGNCINNLPQNVVINIRGYENRIMFERNVKFGEMSKILIDNNVYMKCSEGTRFGKNSVIEMFDSAYLDISRTCFADDVLISSGESATVIIGANSNYGKGNEIIANAYHSLRLGEDILTSRKVVIRAGDGHGLFDVRTKKKRNFIIENTEYNETIVGNHVWIGYEGFVLSPTRIGSGCTIGARSLVKGNYPNNCVLAGNVARVVKTDSAWSRAPLVDDMDIACENSYAIPTVDIRDMDELKLRQRKICDMYEYFDNLSKIDSYIGVIAVKDTPGHKFMKKEKAALNQVNLLGELENKHWCPYIAVFDENKVHYEMVGKENEVLTETVCLNGIDLKVLSAPLHSGNKACIYMDEYDYSVNLRGLNIVLFDKKTKQIFDAVSFDTHSLERKATRKISLF